MTSVTLLATEPEEVLNELLVTGIEYSPHVLDFPLNLEVSFKLGHDIVWEPFQVLELELDPSIEVTSKSPPATPTLCKLLDSESNILRVLKSCLFNGRSIIISVITKIENEALTLVFFDFVLREQFETMTVYLRKMESEVVVQTSNAVELGINEGMRVSVMPSLTLKKRFMSELAPSVFRFTLKTSETPFDFNSKMVILFP